MGCRSRAGCRRAVAARSEEWRRDGSGIEVVRASGASGWWRHRDGSVVEVVRELRWLGRREQRVVAAASGDGS